MGTTTLPRNAYIYCEVCQGEYSATPGDYWNVDGYIIGTYCTPCKGGTAEPSTTRTHRIA